MLESWILQCRRSSNDNTIPYRIVWNVIEKFSQIVFDAGYSSPVRTPRGRDISAACGQLKSESQKIRRSLLDAAAAASSGEAS